MKKMNYSDFSCGSQWEHKTVAAVVVSSPALLLHKSTQDQPHFREGLKKSGNISWLLPFRGARGVSSAIKLFGHKNRCFWYKNAVLSSFKCV